MRLALESVARIGGGELDTTEVAGPDVLNPIIEADRVSTNRAVQHSLMVIQVLEMCSDQLPRTMPELSR